MKLIYIRNDDYIERIRSIVDHTIQTNKIVKSKGKDIGVKRPHIFLVNDDFGEYLKCYPLTSALDKKHAVFSHQRSIKLPNACYFSLGKYGCVKLNNPIFVPKAYTTEIDIAFHSKDFDVERIYNRFRSICKYLKNNGEQLKAKIQKL
jgi:hypothetical protein